jgi:hypothetical protein
MRYATPAPFRQAPADTPFSPLLAARLTYAIAMAYASYAAITTFIN